MKHGKPTRLHYKYRGLVLDEFQQEAIWHIENDTSLLVGAPTGTGKTLIADYLIDTCLKQNQRIIYTAPIKALVNQKYADFAKRFPKSQVGMATGDVTINPQSPVLVMTTEIFRNMLLRQDPRIDSLNWVVFDEIHYLNHQQRGTVWEESILLKPKEIHLLGLSATVPNIKEIAAWIRSIQHEPVAVVEHHQRAVPLKHLYFNQFGKAIERDQLMPTLAEAALHNDDSYDFKAGNLTTDDLFLPRRINYSDPTRFMDLVQFVARNRLFPALYFSFSRRGCEEKAKRLAQRVDYLDSREKHAVSVNVRKRLKELGLPREEIPGLDTFMEQWSKGIGIHHAGLLPVIKQLAETLLEQGLLRILFTTETFAVGVNMPVRTVCFDTLKKYDGVRYRFLTQQEYFQMAGRAGRRGMDREGTVLSLVDFQLIAKTPLPEWQEAALEPIESKFDLSYSIALNLRVRYSDQELKDLFAKTLAGFQDPKQTEVLWQEFRRKVDVLTRLGFLDGPHLTPKGDIGRNIYTHELLLTELVHQSTLQRLKPRQLVGLAASLSWEGKEKLPPVPPETWLASIEAIAEQIVRLGQLEPSERMEITTAAAQPAMAWSSGQELDELVRRLPMDIGDFVQLCRRSIDLLRQLIPVSPQVVANKIEQAIASIDRGVIQVRF